MKYKLSPAISFQKQVCNELVFLIGDLYRYSYNTSLNILFDPLVKLKNNDVLIVLDIVDSQLSGNSYQHWVLSKYGIKKIYDSDLKKFCKKVQ